MLFNSYVFLFAFLPLVVLGYFVLVRYGKALAYAFLVAASLFFYGWWNPIYIPLLCASILFNFTLGKLLDRDGASGWLLAFGVSANLALLGYFKYANFFVDTINGATGAAIELAPIVLPLGISFFTFQKVAYLVDAKRRMVSEHNLLRYSLFVTFFPQLIAGPIVHHREILPQLAADTSRRVSARNLYIGLALFAIGLFKKAVLADGIAQYATPVFRAADAGVQLTLFEAWGGALAYTFQLYFDFSGYADMAIGAARLFGVRLPLNFNSPYKAQNIRDFWRRWHMTLSRFLRDYVYIALGGNRHGAARRRVNLMLTMLLGGFWHGAGWNFVIWGGLHGFYLIAHQTFEAVLTRIRPSPATPSRPAALLARATTFLCVVIGWVFFRAETLGGARAMLEAMAGRNGAVLDERLQRFLPFADGAIVFSGSGIGEFALAGVVWVVALGAVAFVAPNSQELMVRGRPAFESVRAWDANVSWPRLAWRPTPRWAVAIGVVAAFAILGMSRVSEFLYFQF